MRGIAAIWKNDFPVSAESGILAGKLCNQTEIKNQNQPTKYYSLLCRL